MKVVNILIVNNFYVFEKWLFFELGYGVELKVFFVNNEDYEVECVVGELIVYYFINKINYKDYVIFYCGNY